MPQDTIVLHGAGGWISNTTGASGPIKRELATNKENLVTLDFPDNGDSTGMAGSEQNSKAVRTKSEQGKLSNEDKMQQNATTYRDWETNNRS